MMTIETSPLPFDLTLSHSFWIEEEKIAHRNVDLNKIVQCNTLTAVFDLINCVERENREYNYIISVIIGWHLIVVSFFVQIIYSTIKTMWTKMDDPPPAIHDNLLAMHLLSSLVIAFIWHLTIGVSTNSFYSDYVLTLGSQINNRFHFTVWVPQCCCSFCICID